MKHLKNNVIKKKNLDLERMRLDSLIDDRTITPNKRFTYMLRRDYLIGEMDSLPDLTAWQKTRLFFHNLEERFDKNIGIALTHPNKREKYDKYLTEKYGRL